MMAYKLQHHDDAASIVQPRLPLGLLASVFGRGTLYCLFVSQHSRDRKDTVTVGRQAEENNSTLS
jgi:hypothetical protein